MMFNRFEDIHVQFLSQLLLTNDSFYWKTVVTSFVVMLQLFSILSGLMEGKRWTTESTDWALTCLWIRWR